MEITEKVLYLLNNQETTKVHLAHKLGITRPTLDGRISGKTFWKPLEKRFIRDMYSRRAKHGSNKQTSSL